MKKADNQRGHIMGLAAICLVGMLAQPVMAAPDIPQGFDSDGEKIYKRYDETPLAVTTGTDGTRTLNEYYQLRQYPGSPPMVPHEVPSSFATDKLNCLSCHAKGGYDSTKDKYVPVTPHPENESCSQCHVPKHAKKLFRETDWQSINTPKLGLAELPGSPPPIPHSLQLREDCIACHTGNAAVAEIRVEHASRGNCRQCHTPFVSTSPAKEFKRKN